MKKHLCGLLALVSIGLTARADGPPERDKAVQTVVDGVSRAQLERTVRGLAAFPTRHTLSGTGNVDAAALWLEKEFQAISAASGGRLKVERDTWTQPAGTRLPEPHPLTNVVATLPGTGTTGANERVLVVSGHYDSRVTDVMDAKGRAPGANDDASGVAVVLELARRMAGQRYDATIVFAAVTGEEQGLYGSTRLAETLSGKNVEAMWTNDIVGNSRGQNGVCDDRHVRVFSASYEPLATRPADVDAKTRTLARAIRDASRRYQRDFDVTLIFRNDRYGRGGDHSPFLAKGVAAVRFTEPNEDWRHQHQDLRTEKSVVYGDLPEFVDYAYLARVAKTNAAALAELATAPPPPQNVRIRIDLSPDTTLSWQPSPGAVAYEILWRATSAPDWQNRRRVDKAGSVTLPISKDDCVFAVRAIGPTGARGLPAVPR